MSKEKKVYELIDPKSGAVVSQFENPNARAAAAKAANRKATDIILRERGSGNEKQACSLHIFSGRIEPAAKFLPITSFRLAATEKKAGKPIPAELNVKGKEADYIKAGFPVPNKAIVAKLGKYNVPKMAGKNIEECVKEFLKNRPAVEQAKASEKPAEQASVPAPVPAPAKTA